MFQLPHHQDTLAIIVISIPEMFEALFKPYLLKHHTQQLGEGEIMDPLDRCMRQQFERMKALFPKHDIYSMLDFELLPSRRPRVLVQTAGHVAGAAYYYQSSDVRDPPWIESKRIYGVSVHPIYGGWFALRGVLVFRDILVPELKQREPLDCVRSNNKRVELLEEFNFHWQEWRYRDVMDNPVKERYSKEQQQYFGMLPSLRKQLVEQWITSEQHSSVSKN